MPSTEANEQKNKDEEGRKEGRSVLCCAHKKRTKLIRSTPLCFALRWAGLCLCMGACLLACRHEDETWQEGCAMVPGGKGALTLNRGYGDAAERDTAEEMQRLPYLC